MANGMSTKSARSVKSGRSSNTFRRFTSAQLEEQLVKKRQAEHDRLNFWGSNSTYFRAWDFNTAQYSNWTSNEFYANSLESLQKIEETKRKKEKLEERRKKMSALVKNEEETYKKELEKLSKRETVFYEDLNVANMEILLREEEKRRKEREIRLYHYWRQNQPTVKDFERKQHQDLVKRTWLTQVLEKKKEREEDEKKMLEHMEELKRLQTEHEKMEQELKQERKLAEMELQNFLEKQIELIKCKEEQEKILKREETETLKVQKELEDLLEERKRVEEKRKRADLSLFHRRQYQLMLRRRAQEIQENLESDTQLLEKVAADEKLRLQEENAKNARFRKELELAREAFKKQVEVEKLRARQSEFLFDEEAKKMFEKQEIQWRIESEARNKLMKDVLNMIEVQLQEKLLGNIKKQEELKQEREEMIKTMEKANDELKTHKEKTDEVLADWRKDLDQQILEKKLQAYYEKKKLEEDKENELRAKREEEEKLYKELSKMNLLGFQPRPTGRRKFAPL